MIEEGRSLGRACTGSWVALAHRSFDERVAEGHEPEAVAEAWSRYLAAHADATAATDLGHWLAGQNLRGEEADYGSLSFGSLYAAVVAAREASEVARRAEEERRDAEERERRAEDARYRREGDWWFVDCAELGAGTRIEGSEGVESLDRAKRLHAAMVARHYRGRLGRPRSQARACGRPSKATEMPPFRRGTAKNH